MALGARLLHPSHPRKQAPDTAPLDLALNSLQHSC